MHRANSALPRENSVAAARTGARVSKNLYDTLEAYLLSLGDDVTKTTRQLYYAFRRIKNFACVEIHPQSKKLLVFLKTDPSSITLEPGFTRDVTKIPRLSARLSQGSAPWGRRRRP